MPYQISQGTPQLRRRLRNQLFGLDLLPLPMRELVVTAWATSLGASAYADLEDVPWDADHASYGLLRHVNEVTRVGIGFAELAAKEWGKQADNALLIPILVLHDVDKPLLFEPKGGRTVPTALPRELPHGVIGGMIVKELGLSRAIVGAVAMHSPSMPFRGTSFESWILFYADHFVCDRELLTAGKEPIYRRITPHLS
jgi:hypothetical protein